MKYYVVEIAKGDAKIEGKGIYEYGSLDEAEANFHSKLGVAMKSEMYTDETVLVIDSDGVLYMAKHYLRPSEAE